MHDYQKMIITGGDGTVVRGHWKADDESVTVLSAYCQLKTMEGVNWTAAPEPKGKRPGKP